MRVQLISRCSVDNSPLQMGFSFNSQGDSAGKAGIEIDQYECMLAYLRSRLPACVIKRPRIDILAETSQK